MAKKVIVFYWVLSVVSFSVYAQLNKSKIDTTVVTDMLKEGIIKYENRDYKESLNYFKQALAIEPKNYEACYFKAKAEAKLKLFNEAISDFNRTIDLNPTYIEAYKGRAEAKRFADKCDEAIVDYNQAINLDAKDTAMYFGRGACYCKISKFELAIKDLSFCITVWPSLGVSYLYRGLAYNGIGKFKDGIADISSYIEMDGSQTEAYFERAKAFVTLGDAGQKAYYYDAIEDLISYVHVNPSKTKGYIWLGIAQSCIQDSLSSRKSFSKAFNLEQNNSETLVIWGNSELSYPNFNMAIKLYDQAIQIQDQKESDFYLNYARTKVGLKDTIGAIKGFAKSIELDKKNEIAYEERLSLVGTLKLYDSISFYDVNNLIRLYHHPTKLSYAFAFRSSLFSRNGDFQHSMGDINKSIAYSPKDAALYLQRAAIRIMTTKNQTEVRSKILFDINKAIALNPKLPEGYLFKLGFKYKYEKLCDGCCNLLLKAVQEGAQIDDSVKNYFCNRKSINIPVNSEFFFILPAPKKAEETVVH